MDMTKLSSYASATSVPPLEAHLRYCACAKHHNKKKFLVILLQNINCFILYVSSGIFFQHKILSKLFGAIDLCGHIILFKPINKSLFDPI